ncbi:hypothetical protein [Nocardioides sp. SYSU DS0651]|uniref:hypothetical protein n=1 Tax=Nocardioides sp. SYSU DS0651 TaxID=3415955 RepID=UPI003F4C837B
MRATTAFLLVVVATLLAPLAIAATWVTARVDDRESYVATVAPLAEDPEVRRLLADAAADATVQALEQHVPVGLPASVDDWAAAAAATVVASPAFPEFWREANAQLHADVLALVEDPDARAEGYVMVDASPLVGQVLLSLEERGLPVGLLPEIPLNVPVAPESRLVAVSDRYRLVQTAARWLPVIWLALVGCAVLVATGWRGRVRTLGLALLGVAAAAVVVLLAADPLAELAVEQAEVGRERLAGVMLDTVLESLSPYARGFLLAAPAGLLLVAASLWPRPREDSPIPRTDGRLAQ